MARKVCQHDKGTYLRVVGPVGHKVVKKFCSACNQEVPK